MVFAELARIGMALARNRRSIEEKLVPLGPEHRLFPEVAHKSL